MMYNLTLDGVEYTGIGIISITRKAEVKEDNTSGETMSGLYRRGIVGTYYHYDMALNAELASPAEYDSFYNAITTAVPYHSLTAPFGQSVITQNVYITSTTDGVVYMDDGVTRWANFSVSFIAAAPTRVPT